MIEESAKLKDYGGLKLFEVLANSPCDWNIADASYVRAELPSSAEFASEMRARGFILADRTLGVSIDLKRCPVELEKAVRMKVEPSSDFKERIFEIAKASFPTDRRFNVAPLPDAAIAAKIIKGWVDALEAPLVCFFKETPVGFLELKKNHDSMFVHLAAVEEKYRLTGAAMSLYAKAAIVAKEAGCAALEGRISSLNCAVMNLYAHFGAKFFEPHDVFLKEIKNVA